jgi:hypothetical protein
VDHDRSSHEGPRDDASSRVGQQPPQVVYLQQPPVQTNGLAVAAFVLGIVGVVLFWTLLGGLILGLLATVFGAMGLARAKRGAPNKGMAIAGLVLGIVAMLLTLFWISTMVVSFEGESNRVPVAVVGLVR